uniref:Serpentine receptor class gamma n=1 Tax=Panagrellus redivivus TaxID=6233 RepID=A0A7E4VVT5_PANRE
MSLTVSFYAIEFISVNLLPYQYLQYFIPLLSIVAALNRFSAIVLWKFYDRIWTWNRLCIYIETVFLVSFIIVLTIHIDFQNLPEFRNKTVARVFKASAYVIAFIFEVTAVIYRVHSKESGKIDKVDVTLLTQSVISTVCWLVNCACNIAGENFNYPICLVTISDAMVFCGFVLPLLYLFMTK